MRDVTAADVDAFLLAREEVEHPEPARKGRKHTAATKKRIHDFHVALALEKAEADPNVSPVKLARLRKGMSVADIEARGVGRGALWRAEARPELCGEPTWRRLSLILKVPIGTLKGES